MRYLLLALAIAHPAQDLLGRARAPSPGPRSQCPSGYSKRGANRYRRAGASARKRVGSQASGAGCNGTMGSDATGDQRNQPACNHQLHARGQFHQLYEPVEPARASGSSATVPHRRAFG